MCVIILTKPDNQITEAELAAAWNTNPDGAGLAYNEGGRVIFERGFMNRAHYVETVQELQQERPLLLHMRISTGAGVTPQGTHPYKAGNVLKMKGETREAVLAMNGTIRGQRLETKQGARLNDTASYLWNHAEAFQTVNASLLDILATATGAKWAAVTPEGIFTGGEFQEYNGRLYSNLNHLWLLEYAQEEPDEAPGLRYWWEEETTEDGLAYLPYLRLSDLLDEELYEAVKSNWLLWDELEEYVLTYCNKPACHRCTGCLTEAGTLDELEEFLRFQREDVLTLQDLETLAGRGQF